MARSWYAFTGGDPLQALNYSLAGVTPACLTGSTICAIYVPNGGTSPTAPLSKNVQRYISAGLTTGISQPQDSGAFKQYVYLKSL